MMFGVDKDRLHLWMGLTHPVLGPTNLAWYLASLSLSTSYACYVTWIQMLIDTTYRDKAASEKPRSPL